MDAMARCRFISGDLSGLSERYQLEEKTIGEGGYGSVYRAYDKALKTMRAIKRIEKSRALSMQARWSESMVNMIHIDINYY